MFRRIAFCSSLLATLFLAAFCYSAVADERFPDSDIQWILDQYQVSAPVSLIPAEGLTGWTRTNARPIAEQSKWTNRDGTLVFENSENTRDLQGGDVVTAKQYTNFVFDFVWVASRRCNSGIKYRLKDFGDTGASHARGWLGPEYQILDDGTNNDRGSTASLYHVIAPDGSKKKLNPHGEANTGRIVVLDNHIEHWLNGVKIMHCEVGSDAWKEAIAASKFTRDNNGGCFGFGANPTGFILLQDHGSTVIFGKLTIREIGDKR